MQQDSVLVIDIGNTRMKWSVVSASSIGVASAQTHAKEDFSAVLDSAFAPLSRPGRVVVGNVAGRKCERLLTSWVLEHWGIQPSFVVPAAVGGGVVSGYEEPRRLGVDRWAALVGARSLVAGAACVIDCGTCITVDVLSAEGRHQGGLIAPGIFLMRRALVRNTADITLGEPTPGPGPVSLLASNTRDAVFGGTLYAAVALIDRVVADVGLELGRDVATLLTGGDAETLLPLLSVSCRHEPDLTLRGLALLGDAL